jgi:hypothetical protein
MPSKPAENRHILAWWTSKHDDALKVLIETWQWAWCERSADAIVAITAPETLAAWRKRDHRCRRHAWYNVLANFCEARAEDCGFTAEIRRPKLRSCLVCGQNIFEHVVPLAFVERLGVDRLTFCITCMRQAFVLEGREDASPEEVTAFAQDLTTIAGRVPPEDFGRKGNDLRYLDDSSRASLIRLLQQRPSRKRVSELFGSWFEVLRVAGVLEDGARRMSRGTQCCALDGHLCFSLGEKTIDDFLFERNIAHEREPRYPQSNLRGDFSVGEVFIEYFGLAGDSEYDTKIAKKVALAREHGIRLLAIYPTDVCSRSALTQKLGTLLPVAIEPSP